LSMASMDRLAIDNVGEPDPIVHSLGMPCLPRLALRLPMAVAGFTPVSLLAALYSVLRQSLEGHPFLDNCYPEVVRPGGNPVARPNWPPPWTW
jgi:hydrogenase maturation factor